MMSHRLNKGAGQGVSVGQFHLSRSKLIEFVAGAAMQCLASAGKLGPMLDVLTLMKEAQPLAFRTLRRQLCGRRSDGRHNGLE
eukprot:3301726-Amphidinium_carterae.1